MRATTFASLLLLAAPALWPAEPPRLQPGAPGTVTVPLPEYDRLVERARKGQPPPAVPPVEVALARAEARGAVSERLARGSLTLEGEVYATGVVKLPLGALPASGLTLLEARSAGRPVPLVQAAGQVQALLRGPGAFSLQLEWVAPVASDPGRASFALPVPRAGSVRAVVDLPGSNADVGLQHGVVTRKTALPGKTQVEATLEPGQAARFTWSARETALQPAREARLLSDVKTLVSVGEGELSMVALVDVSVVEGEASQVVLELPGDLELTGVSGSTLEQTAEGPGTLAVGLQAGRRHQVVVSLARAGAEGGPLGLVSVRGAQRETGEVGVAGQGTVELQAQEGGTLRRMDPAEASPGLRALDGEPLLLAFRYHRRDGEGPALALDVRRFAPAAVLPALAERGVATTLVTPEGRTLTEVRLTVHNQAQPFLKLELPEGAALLSAEVAGEGVKPVSAADGTRVPLLRAGFRPSGPYEVSFVYQQPGPPLGKKGEARLSLPRLDLPVSLVEWELFLPERYEIRNFGGNARRELAVVPPEGIVGGVEGGVVGGVPGGLVGGIVGGRADADTLAETVTITGQAPAVSGDDLRRKQRAEEQAQAQAQLNAPSSNVFALQRRVAGVLPVRVDVPRSGESYRFARALALDDATTVSFGYKARGR